MKKPAGMAGGIFNSFRIWLPALGSGLAGFFENPSDDARF